MKVTGINAGNVTSKTKETKKTGGPSFASHMQEASDIGATQATSAAASIAPTNGLFMLQEIDGDQPSRQQTVQRGKDMVQYLDEIRIGLLEGAISPAMLQNLDQLITKWRETTNDPDLETLIDEIELRAAVELAKLSV